MKLLTLQIFQSRSGAQEIDSLTPAEHDFINNTAFPVLDATDSERALEKLGDGLWNLCLWEAQRTTALDTKAAALLNLSSLATVVVAAVSALGPGVNHNRAVLIALSPSVILFIITVLLSIRAQGVARLGGFLDIDVFEALSACRKPVGSTPPFKDSDEYRCFLRETAIQRWLVYRQRCDQNDSKSRRLGAAQLSAAFAVASLLVVVVKGLL